jgi:hypothetical protein
VGLGREWLGLLVGPEAALLATKRGPSQAHARQASE